MCVQVAELRSELALAKGGHLSTTINREIELLKEQVKMFFQSHIPYTFTLRIPNSPSYPTSLVYQLARLYGFHLIPT